VDLEGSDLVGGIHQVFDVEIPEGTYDDVRFVINTLSRHQAAGDGGLSEMKDLHASIAADGSFGGSPFRFTTSIHLQQKQEGPFTVGQGTKNITLTVDPSGWFVGGHGQVLDPTDPRNRGRILANVRCSVRMSSEAPDHDGRQLRRDFEDDENDDRCSASDDDDGGQGDFEPSGRDDHRGGQGDHPGDDGDHHACLPAPVLDCGDGGTPAADGGSSADGGVDGGLH
jgi:hypothetical protein